MGQLLDVHRLASAAVGFDLVNLALKETPVPSFFLKTTDLSATPFFRSLTIARPHPALLCACRLLCGCLPALPAFAALPRLPWCVPAACALLCCLPACVLPCCLRCSPLLPLIDKQFT